MDLARIKVSIDMYPQGSGRFLARLVQDCQCGDWGMTTTLAEWSNLESITDSARRHIPDCKL